MVRTGIPTGDGSTITGDDADSGDDDGGGSSDGDISGIYADPAGSTADDDGGSGGDSGGDGGGGSPAGQFGEELGGDPAGTTSGGGGGGGGGGDSSAGDTSGIYADPAGRDDRTGGDTRVAGPTSSTGIPGATRDQREDVRRGVRQDRQRERNRRLDRSRPGQETRTGQGVELGNPAQGVPPAVVDQAQELERDVLEQYPGLDESDVGIFYDEETGQLIPEFTDEGEEDLRRRQRDQATEKLEAQLEAELGFDVVPGEDFSVVPTGDGGFRAEPTEQLLEVVEERRRTATSGGGAGGGGVVGAEGDPAAVRIESQLERQIGARRATMLGITNAAFREAVIESTDLRRGEDFTIEQTTEDGETVLQASLTPAFEREFATDVIERELESVYNRDLEPGRDFSVSREEDDSFSHEVADHVPAPERAAFEGERMESVTVQPTIGPAFELDVNVLQETVDRLTGDPTTPEFEDLTLEEFLAGESAEFRQNIQEPIATAAGDVVRSFPEEVRTEAGARRVEGVIGAPLGFVDPAGLAKTVVEGTEAGYRIGETAVGQRPGGRFAPGVTGVELVDPDDPASVEEGISQVSVPIQPTAGPGYTVDVAVDRSEAGVDVFEGGTGGAAEGFVEETATQVGESVQTPRGRGALFGSLVLTAGGGAALARVSPTAARGYWWTIQPGEELASAGLTRAFPRTASRIPGGRIDWEEIALAGGVRLGRGIRARAGQAGARTSEIASRTAGGASQLSARSPSIRFEIDPDAGLLEVDPLLARQLRDATIERPTLAIRGGFEAARELPAAAVARSRAGVESGVELAREAPTRIARAPGEFALGYEAGRFGELEAGPESTFSFRTGERTGLAVRRGDRRAQASAYLLGRSVGEGIAHVEAAPEYMGQQYTRAAIRAGDLRYRIGEGANEFSESLRAAPGRGIELSEEFADAAIAAGVDLRTAAGEHYLAARRGASAFGTRLSELPGELWPAPSGGFDFPIDLRAVPLRGLEFSQEFIDAARSAGVGVRAAAGEQLLTARRRALAAGERVGALPARGLEISEQFVDAAFGAGVDLRVAAGEQLLETRQRARAAGTRVREIPAQGLEFSEELLGTARAAGAGLRFAAGEQYLAARQGAIATGARIRAVPSELLGDVDANFPDLRSIPARGLERSEEFIDAAIAAGVDLRAAAGERLIGTRDRVWAASGPLRAIPGEVRAVSSRGLELPREFAGAARAAGVDLRVGAEQAVARAQRGAGAFGARLGEFWPEPGGGFPDFRAIPARGVELTGEFVDAARAAGVDLRTAAGEQYFAARQGALAAAGELRAAPGRGLEISREFVDTARAAGVDLRVAAGEQVIAARRGARAVGARVGEIPALLRADSPGFEFPDLVGAAQTAGIALRSSAGRAYTQARELPGEQIDRLLAFDPGLLGTIDTISGRAVSAGERIRTSPREARAGFAIGRGSAAFSEIPAFEAYPGQIQGGRPFRLGFGAGERVGLLETGVGLGVGRVSEHLGAARRGATALPDLTIRLEPGLPSRPTIDASEIEDYQPADLGIDYDFGTEPSEVETEDVDESPDDEAPIPSPSTPSAEAGPGVGVEFDLGRSGPIPMSVEADVEGSRAARQAERELDRARTAAEISVGRAAGDRITPDVGETLDERLDAGEALAPEIEAETEAEAETEIEIEGRTETPLEIETAVEAEAGIETELEFETEQPPIEAPPVEFPQPGEQEPRPPERERETFPEVQAAGDEFRAPGWVFETVTDLALGAGDTEYPTTERLEAFDETAGLTGEYPTLEWLEGSEAEREAISETYELLNPGAGEPDVEGGAAGTADEFDVGFGLDLEGDGYGGWWSF